jgi:enamine deaminase RidA (YjgF/YER057c/UK114 family)
MPIERIQPPGLARPTVYAHVVKTGSTVYIAGQVAQDESGAVVGRGDITAQVTQVFENLKKALASVGADFSHLVKITAYLTDPRYREALTSVRSQYLQTDLPASTLVVVAGLANPDWLVEIEGVAYLG